jgi:hypothetical protein
MWRIIICRFVTRLAFSPNKINVLHRFPPFVRLSKNGQEIMRSKVTRTKKGTTKPMPSIDKWLTFVNTIRDPYTEKKSWFAACLKSCRKDVVRFFYASRFFCYCPVLSSNIVEVSHVWCYERLCDHAQYDRWQWVCCSSGWWSSIWLPGFLPKLIRCWSRLKIFSHVSRNPWWTASSSNCQMI